jgi:Cyclic nucleotide-binding domain
MRGHEYAVDDSCIGNFDTAGEAALAYQRLSRDRGWEDVMFTIEELATIPLFSTLGEKELEYLAGAVEDIHLIPGEYVGHEGEGRSLAIVVEGKTELTKLVNGVEEVIGVRLPGEVGGEIPMTLGTPLPASMRAVEPSRVLKVTVEVFHTPQCWSACRRSRTPPLSRASPQCSSSARASTPECTAVTASYTAIKFLTNG